jgi:hypothetical protein
VLPLLKVENAGELVQIGARADWLLGGLALDDYAVPLGAVEARDVDLAAGAGEVTHELLVAKGVQHVLHPPGEQVARRFESGSTSLIVTPMAAPILALA